MPAQIIDGKAIAAEVRQEVTREAKALTDADVTPGLATVLVGEDPASKIYISSKQKACAEVGIRVSDHPLPASTPEDELLDLIRQLNDDPAVHGILVQLPLPEHLDEQKVLDLLSPTKDADGLHPCNLGRVVAGDPLVAPATPSGIQELLIRSNVETAGSEVVVVGRSNLVGKPIAAMLQQKGPGANSTVTVCHTGTKDLEVHTKRADILIAAMGRPKVITAPVVKEGVTVIDVGVNRTEDGLCGDVDFEAVKEIASAITPVPGGVGPMTIAMLLRNTVTLARRAANA